MESLADFTGGGLYSSFPCKGPHRSVKYTKLQCNHDGDDEGLYGKIADIYTRTKHKIKINFQMSIFHFMYNFTYWKEMLNIP